MARKRTLSIDIGGSGVKAIVLDERGKPITERARVKTPAPATPGAILKAIGSLAQSQGSFERVSIGFPGVIRKGVVYTAYNLSPRWVGFNLGREASRRLRRPVRVANDADIQGMGAIRGRGVELTITLGTGMGSALFVDGKLVPNLELGHHPFHKGEEYEDLLGDEGRKQIGDGRWNRLLERAIAELEHLFNYDMLHIGGGNTKYIKFQLPENARIVPNVLGLLGGIALWKE